MKKVLTSLLLLAISGASLATEEPQKKAPSERIVCYDCTFSDGHMLCKKCLVETIGPPR